MALTAEDIKKRYDDLADQVNAQLPAGTSDEERKRIILEAIERQAEKDLELLTQQAMADLEKIELDADVAVEAEKHHETLEQIRRSLQEAA